MKKKAGSRWFAVSIVIIFLLAAVLRLVSLDRYPLPIHQDELSDIYDGYAIATTGADRFGDSWPLIVRGMGPGDYHPPLYAYLAAVSTKLLGFSVWAGRLPSAIAGAVTVFLVFIVARSMFGWTSGLLAALFIAFSPIHILYSRQAHPGVCLSPLFAIVVVYLLYRALDHIGRDASHRRAQSDKRDEFDTPRGLKPEAQGECSARHREIIWVAAAGLAIGASTNAYGALRLSALLFALLGALMLLIQVGFRRRKWSRASILLIVLALTSAFGAGPQLLAMTHNPEAFFSRASTVVYPISNGLVWWAQKLVTNLALNLDPRHLFLSFGEYRDLTIVRLNIVSMPFLYVGLMAAIVRVWRLRCACSLLLLFSVLICLMPALTSRPNPNAMRSAGVWALYPIICAMGALTIGTTIRKLWDRLAGPANNRHLDRHRLWKKPATMALAVALAGEGIFNAARFLNRPDLQGVVSQNHLVKLGTWIGAHGLGYDRIHIDTPGHFPYLYTAAFSGMSPRTFQQTPRAGIVTLLGWEKFHRFGRFHFTTVDEAQKAWEESDKNERWLIVKAHGSAIDSFEPGEHQHVSIRHR